MGTVPPAGTTKTVGAWATISTQADLRNFIIAQVLPTIGVVVDSYVSGADTYDVVKWVDSTSTGGNGVAYVVVKTTTYNSEFWSNAIIYSTWNVASHSGSMCYWPKPLFSLTLRLADQVRSVVLVDAKHALIYTLAKRSTRTYVGFVLDLITPSARPDGYPAAAAYLIWWSVCGWQYYPSGIPLDGIGWSSEIMAPQALVGIGVDRANIGTQLIGVVLMSAVTGLGYNSLQFSGAYDTPSGILVLTSLPIYGIDGKLIGATSDYIGFVRRGVVSATDLLQCADGTTWGQMTDGNSSVLMWREEAMP